MPQIADAKKKDEPRNSFFYDGLDELAIAVTGMAEQCFYQVVDCANDLPPDAKVDPLVQIRFLVASRYEYEKKRNGRILTPTWQPRTQHADDDWGG